MANLVCFKLNNMHHVWDNISYTFFVFIGHLSLWDYDI